MLSEMGAEIEAVNEVGAEMGQTVRVTLAGETYIKGSLMIYGLPAIALVIGAVVGKEYWPVWFPDMNPDTGSALLGFGFFGLSLLIVKVWGKFAEKETQYQPVIAEVIQSADEES